MTDSQTSIDTDLLRSVPQTILVVDDDDRFVRRTSAHLEARGFATLTAADGRTALRMCRDIRPDLICSDLQMPELDGLQLGRALRELRAYDQVPIILCTAAPRDDERVVQFARLTDIQVVHKPITPEELGDVVEDRLDSSLELRGHRVRQSVAAALIDLKG
jgi:DNA-binding response OmpR family regulator